MLGGGGWGERGHKTFYILIYSNQENDKIAYARICRGNRGTKVVQLMASNFAL
jgi:hypothetical protein